MLHLSPQPNPHPKSPTSRNSDMGPRRGQTHEAELRVLRSLRLSFQGPVSPLLSSSLFSHVLSASI